MGGFNLAIAVYSRRLYKVTERFFNRFGRMFVYRSSIIYIFMNNYFSVEEKCIEMYVDQKLNLEALLTAVEERKEDELRLFI